MTNNTDSSSNTDPTRIAPEGKATKVKTDEHTAKTTLNPIDATDITSQDTAAIEVLNNRFHLLDEVARGGMGVVYRALDRRKEEAKDRDKYIAIKILSENFLKVYPDAYISLQREAKKAQKLAHPNIVTVFDFDRDGETVFMTMELLQGSSLDNLIKKNPHGMSLEQALPIIEKIGNGLGYAHQQGVVHSDIKPNNIFLSDSSEIKILDFGIASAAHNPQGDENATLYNPRQIGALTKSYASLEMFLQAEADPRDDIYSLACVTYELLSGHHPFNKDSALAAYKNNAEPTPIKGLTQTQWNTLKRGLNFKKEDRISTVEDFINGLRQPDKRRGKIIAATAAVSVFLMIGAYVAFEKITINSQPTPEPIPAAIEPQKPPQPEKTPTTVALVQNSLPQSPALILSPSATQYQPNDTFWFHVATSAAMHLNCYYSDNHQIVRIFPNRFQSQTLIQPGKKIQIPDTHLKEGFDIVLETPDVTESIVCIGTQQDVTSLLPENLQIADLTPIEIESMDDIIAAYQQTDSQAAIERLMITVGASE